MDIQGWELTLVSFSLQFFRRGPGIIVRNGFSFVSAVVAVAVVVVAVAVGGGRRMKKNVADATRDKFDF